MSENLITPEIAAGNATREGGYTYNSYPPAGFEGKIFVFAVLGLGDHAHVQVGTAFWHDVPHLAHQLGSHGIAGNFVVQWRDWLQLRDMLEPRPDVRVAEVRRASLGQLEAHGVGGTG